MNPGLRLSALFSDHMVLQRDQALNIWGWAPPAERVEVEIAGLFANTLADDHGRWALQLEAPAAGGPYRLAVRTAHGETITVRDVLVGEVWLCAGQSNMEFPTGASSGAEGKTLDVDFPEIRFLTVPQIPAGSPVESLSGTAWQACSPESARNFSAVAFYFGRELHRKLGVPVGLINASWGGTAAESWIGGETISRIPALAEMWKAQEERVARSRRNCPDALVNTPSGADAGQENHGFSAGWGSPRPPSGKWGKMELPAQWQQRGLDFSGVLWFRREVELPEEWAERELILALGAADKEDITYFNNVPVGSLGMGDRKDSHTVPREYSVPAGLAKAGRNLVAVRVRSGFFDGGLTGPAGKMFLACPSIPKAAPISLSGSWDFAIECNLGYRSPNALAQLFNGMISPLRHFAIRGAAWYQGEANEANGPLYRELLPALISDWRACFGNDRLVFLIVQLPGFRSPRSFEKDSQWAILREAQLAATQLPYTGLAVTLDLGEAENIHPANKRDVGNRLARQALASVYGQKDIVPCGPLVKDWNSEGNSIRVTFQHAESGLLVRGETLEGFVIAGENGEFHSASARVDGQTVIASSAAVQRPCTLRYGWADNPLCNLFNGAGLPASPFRTDGKA